MRSVGLSPLSPLLDASPRSDGHPAELVELTLQRTIACAIVEEALGEPSVDRLALLSSLDKSWTATELLELEGHRLNVQCNATLTREEAAALARRAREARWPLADVAAAAWALAERLGTEVERGTRALPVAGCSARGSLLALYAWPLFVCIGVPIGLISSALTDWWLGEGILRGLAQCAVGLWHDATTVRREVAAGQHGWPDLFEQLLVPRAARRCKGVDGARGASLCEAARFDALRPLVRARWVAAGLFLPPHGLPPPLLTFTAGPVLQVPNFDPVTWAAVFPTATSGEGAASLRLALSGGGLLDHNFEVRELQAARRAFHLLWIVAELRSGLRAAGTARTQALLDLLEAG